MFKFYQFENTACDASIFVLVSLSFYLPATIMHSSFESIHEMYFLLYPENTLYWMQVLGKIYAILSDANKRAVYDEDGTVDEEDETTFSQVWSEIGGS